MLIAQLIDISRKVAPGPTVAIHEKLLFARKGLQRIAGKRDIERASQAQHISVIHPARRHTFAELLDR